MKVSVIVPACEGISEKSLSFCMDSLVNQTADEYEIIAVSEFGCDKSFDLLKGYEKKHPGKVRALMSSEKRGTGGAKNLGLRNATGEWICFVEGDDWVCGDWLETLLKKGSETNADIVGCKKTAVETYTFEAGEVLPSDGGAYSGEMDWDKHAIAILSPGSMSVKLYRRKIFDDNGIWFPEQNVFDELCAGELALMYCQRFEFVDEPKYFILKDKNRNEKVTKKICDDRLDSMSILMEECFKREFLEEYPEELEYRFTKVFYVDTLFMYMDRMPFFKRRISYLRLLREGICSCFPDFDTNPYFEQLLDEEKRSRAYMNLMSPFRFFLGYTFKRIFNNQTEKER